MKTKGLSAAFLKNLAIILMFVNHFCAAWNNAVVNDSWFLNEGHWYFTRMAFPIFAFLIAEGMSKTKNRRNYMLRVLFIAVISEPVYDWALNGQWYYPQDQNVYFDLLSGMLAIVVYDRFKDQKIILIPLIALIILSTIFMCFNYCMMAVLVILFSYIYLQDKTELTVTLTLILFCCSYLIYFVVAWRNGMNISYMAPYLILNARIESCCVCAVPLIYLYNGERGRQLPKWFYYLFYPAHLLLIGLIFSR